MPIPNGRPGFLELGGSFLMRFRSGPCFSVEEGGVGVGVRVRIQKRVRPKNDPNDYQYKFHIQQKGPQQNFTGN